MNPNLKWFSSSPLVLSVPFTCLCGSCSNCRSWGQAQLGKFSRRNGFDFFWELLANKSLLKTQAVCVYHRQEACFGQLNQFSVWQTFLLLTGSGTSFDFHKKIDYLFLVGTEEGKIYKVKMISLSFVLHPLTLVCLSGSSSELFAQVVTKYRFRAWSCPGMPVVSLRPDQHCRGSQGALCTDPIKTLFCRNVFHANCIQENALQISAGQEKY